MSLKISKPSGRIAPEGKKSIDAIKARHLEKARLYGLPGTEKGECPTAIGIVAAMIRSIAILIQMFSLTILA